MEVVGAGDVEGLDDAMRRGQVVVELLDVLLAVAAEADLDHGLERVSEGPDVDVEAAAHDDTAVAHGSQPVGARRLGEAEARREGLVGELGVGAELAQDAAVDGVEDGGGRLCFRQRGLPGSLFYLLEDCNIGGSLGSSTINMA